VAYSDVSNVLLVQTDDSIRLWHWSWYCMWPCKMFLNISDLISHRLMTCWIDAGKMWPRPRF